MLNTKLNDSLRVAIDYLSKGPAINGDRSSFAYGGVDGLIRVDKPKRETDMPFVFAEITGYQVEIMLKLWSWYGESRYLDQARESGDWLVKAACKKDDQARRGAFGDRWYKHTRTFTDYHYSYPTAVCASALFDLYEATNNEEYLGTAKAAMEWLSNAMWFQISDSAGCYREYYNTKERVFSDKVYPYEALCVAASFLRASKWTNTEQLERARKSVVWVLKTQSPDGSFPYYYSMKSRRWNSNSYTHFVLYFLYNLVGFPLLDLHSLLPQEGLLDAATRCADWLTARQRDDGGFSTYYYGSRGSDHVQSPAIAQAACALLELHKRTGVTRYREAALRAADWLSSHQIRSGKGLDGSFFWIYPNKRSSWLAGHLEFLASVLRNAGLPLPEPYMGFLDSVPTWAVQFSVEAFHRAAEQR